VVFLGDLVDRGPRVLDSLRLVKARENGLDSFPWIAWPRRDRKARELEHTVRILPRQEVRELVRAYEEDRVGEPMLATLVRAQRVHRVGVSFGMDLGTGEAGEREPRELEALLERELGLLVAGIEDDEDEELLDVEALERSLHQRHVAVVGRIEDTAVETCHSYSTWSPGRTPAARSASSGASPRTR
jgi:hypothetical protein